MTTPGQDEKLRDLERRFRQTGSPDDEAAWLLERVRVGDLALSAVEAAASLGDRAAQAFMKVTAPVAFSGRGGELREMLTPAARQLSTDQLVTFIRLCAERILPAWEAGFPLDQRPREAVALIRAWHPEGHAQRLPQYFSADRQVRDALSQAAPVAYPPSGTEGRREERAAMEAARALLECLMALASAPLGRDGASTANMLYQLLLGLMNIREAVGVSADADFHWATSALCGLLLRSDVQRGLGQT